jgi:hypothetical protein
MSMKIEINPAGLNQEQREAVCGFILAFPVGTTTPVAAVPSELDKEIGYLAKEGEAFDASVAFDKPTGDSAAAAVFGSGVNPLAQGATAAPFTAAAVPSPTAPVAPVDSSTSTIVPAIHAPIVPVADALMAPVVPMNPASGVELDKHGLPWDARIHAGTKRKNADGFWTAKRGIDQALVTTVEAELRQVMAAGTPVAPLAPVASIPAPPAATVTIPTPGVASSVAVVPAPPAPLVAPTAPAPEAPSADGRTLFVGLIGRASAAMNAGKLTQEEVTQICSKFGIPALPLLANRLDLVAQVASEIDALIAAR